MVPLLYNSVLFFRVSLFLDLLYDFVVCSMVPLLYDSVLFFMVSLLLEEDAASQESVSSTAGAPCNVVSLCNRAGELGLGYVRRVG